MTDLAQMVELQQSLTILGTIGGLALALLGAGLAAVLPGIGSAKGVASSLSTNPGVSAREGARVLLLRWASPALGGYIIPSSEPAWQTQGDDTATRLECLKAEGLVMQTVGPDGPVWVVPFDRVIADANRLTPIVAG